MQILIAANCLCYVNSFSRTGCCTRQRQHDSVQMSLRVVLIGKKTSMRKQKKRIMSSFIMCHISANASHLPHSIISWCFVWWELVCTRLPSVWLPPIIILHSPALCFAHASVGCGIQTKAEWWRDKTGKRMNLLMRAISAKPKQIQRAKIILSGR